MDQQFTRTLNLAGASNFRDIGGYQGQDGKLVRWRRLFRSDHLAALTEQDTLALADIGVSRALDFRGDAERAALAYAIPNVRYHALSIEPTVVQRAKEMVLAGEQMTAPIAVSLMQDTYRAFVSHNARQYAELFEHLLEDDRPLVFHCTAGKDRTGFAAALILLSLGVPRPVVMEDYLLTNALYRRPASFNNGAPDEVLNVLWRVQEDFLEAALQAVDADHGGLGQYLERQLGVGEKERARLAELYLTEPVHKKS
ncbi:tyrosine-protein phosphatase [Diaphorobacter aerolatus]|uniref:Tyrosine-protein phosphatase n=1 Tax=Diaphorobacter aerolatus TaxID=1288495 RepID=A0A7H0GH73_9BURK|nr:tyrosine-protein phosphatase [Diaphorobacter aerolatus]QNP47639.1 tyrosine-protein phosphatase [Diaphorobacter aerolatus]